MATTHVDLAILSAEHYDTGIPPRGVRRIRQTAPTGGEDGSAARKRAKTQAVARTEHATDKEAEGAEKKRVRGRPRLNTNDETAVERRRTQIRLAQRAYRNRKESAITTLEKQVRDLRDTNEEMSNAFMMLHDFAVRRGLLDHSPDFGTQLKSTTEKFLALARRTAETGYIGDDDAAPVVPSSSRSPEQPEKGILTPPNGHSGSGGSTNSADESQHQQQQLLGGPVVTHRPVPEPESDMVLSSVLSSGGPSAGFSTAASLPTTIPDLEVITQPTFENASFPFTFTDAQLDSLLNPSPYPHANSLPSPITYAAREATFGRRLQRIALERALYLISLPNPPPLRLVRVFGFVLPFESADAIRKRLQLGLDRSRHESLYFWHQPFQHAGGAGTHFQNPGAEYADDTTSSGSGSATTTPPASTTTASSVSNGGGRLMGNQGTVDVLRTRRGTGLSTGPFSRAVEETRDFRLDRRMRITVPGFEGDFYDPDEVELYLHRLGVDIPPGQDFVELEVDLSAFADTPKSGLAATAAAHAHQQPHQPHQHPQHQHQQQQHHDTSPPESVSGRGVEHVHFPTLPAGLFPSPAFMGLHGGSNSAGGGGGGGLGAMGNEFSAGNNGPVPSPPTLATSQGGEVTAASTETLWAAAETDLAGYGFSADGSFNPGGASSAGMLSFTATGGLSGMSQQQQQQQQQQSRPRKTLVTLDIDLFIQKLTDKATCLGRSPGFRIENVREAFLASAQYSERVVSLV